MIWIAIRVYLALQTAWSEQKHQAILVENTRQLAPSLDVATAELHAEAAMAAGRDAGIEPELLLAVAFVESHYDPTWTSHVVDGVRVTSRWPSTSRVGSGPWFCGVMQTKAGLDWSACLAMRELRAGYRAGAAELREWIGYANGDIAAALDGHGCGTHGLRTRRCNHYAARVRTRWQRLKLRSSS